MSAALLRILVFAIVGIAIWLGFRKIWRDWTSKFKADDDEQRRLRRERDLAERQQPGIIDLKRGEDGTFRPGDKKD